METLERSTIDILVNYPTQGDLPSDVEDVDPKAELRQIAARAMEPDRFEAVRFEPQVGSDFSAKAGNAITHLVRDEDIQSAAVLRPCVPRLTRSVIDEAALKLRRADVVIGPACRGQVYYAGFSDLIDFEGVFGTRPVEEITRRAVEEGLAVDFQRSRELLWEPEDLVGVLSRLNADTLAGKPVPEHTWETVQEREIAMVDGELTSRDAEGTDSS
ncbi:MAG: DUF2064 domain-containing protein [Halodesulfurarchaeum sp.]|nr:DUF2064 domain-containing protein [Halodesulfurarchaeum sp.]